MKGKYECLCQSGTGKTVRIVIEAINYSQAHHKLKKEMAIRFRGKTFKVREPVKYVEPV